MADRIIVNEYDLMRRGREEWTRAFGALDAKRPMAWLQYGYHVSVDFPQLYRAYERGGPGHGAVHRLLDKCWQHRPRIKSPASDKETSWEKGVAKLLDGIQAWRKLRDLDRRNMVGRYAALIYRVKDGKALREPLAHGGQLVDLVPLYEDQIKVTKWVDDAESPDFGKPAMFEYRSRSMVADTVDLQAMPDQWLAVHPSRVQILAEGAINNMFEGVPLLLAGFNHLSDLEKVAGGSAEAFLKNSARTLVFEYEPEASPQSLAVGPDAGKEVIEIHRQRARDLNRNLDSAIVMQGGKATTLQTSVSDPRATFEVAANLFAASVQIPFTVLFGQQTGRLASDEDQADFNARCLSRQINELTPMLEELVKRLQAAGIVDEAEFQIEWPPLDAPSDEQKLANLGKATAAMQQAFNAGLTRPIFDENELRRMAGFEERKDGDDGMPGEEETAAALAAEEALARAKGEADPEPENEPAQGSKGSVGRPAARRPA